MVSKGVFNIRGKGLPKPKTNVYVYIYILHMYVCIYMICMYIYIHMICVLSFEMESKKCRPGVDRILILHKILTKMEIVRKSRYSIYFRMIVYTFKSLE